MFLQYFRMERLYIAEDQIDSKFAKCVLFSFISSDDINDMNEQQIEMVPLNEVNHRVKLNKCNGVAVW